MKKDALSPLFGADFVPDDPPSRGDGSSCIAPYDAVGYAAGRLSQAEHEAVERHTRSCGSCTSFLAGVVSGQHELECEERLRSWLATQARQNRPVARGSSPNPRASRGDDVSTGGLRLPLAVSGDLATAVLGQAFETPQCLEGSSPDGSLRWRLVDEGVQLVATFETDLVDFVESSALQLKCGVFERRLTFQRCAGRILSTVVIPKEALTAPLGSSPLGLELSMP